MKRTLLLLASAAALIGLAACDLDDFDDGHGGRHHGRHHDHDGGGWGDHDHDGHDGGGGGHHRGNH